MSQGEPMLAGCRLQGAERTDGAMAGAVGCADGFDEKVIGVGFAADCLARWFEEHFVPIYREIGTNTREICWRSQQRGELVDACCGLWFQRDIGLRLFVTIFGFSERSD